MSKLSWIEIAKKYVGTREIKGGKHNPIILSMWKRAYLALRAKVVVQEDETAWCGTFVASVLKEAGLDKHIPTAFAWARSYLKVGTKLQYPAVGCIVIFERGKGGHVGFVVGQDKRGNLMVLGGNQGDKVSIASFSKHRVLGYRWAGFADKPNPVRYKLPILNGTKLSTNEI